MSKCRIADEFYKLVSRGFLSN